MQDDVSDDDAAHTPDESLGDTNSHLDDDEMFIPNGDDFIRSDSSVTKGQAVVLLMSYVLRHNLTGVAVTDLLELLNIFAPGCVPLSKFLLTKGFCNGCLEAYLYCGVCMSYVGKYSSNRDLTKCPVCDTLVTRDQCLKNGNFFLYMPIESQLKLLLRRYSPCSKRVGSDSLTSIFSGCLMKQYVEQNDITDSDLTLIWNCDGAPVFSSSKVSVWPLQACVNELPVTCTDNLLLIGLWFSKEKPTSHCYLKPFVDELQHLSTSGMIYRNNDDQTVSCRVFAVCCSTDSCARPLLRNCVQFNGKYGCDWCKQEGAVIKRGDGFSRVYEPSLSREPLELRDQTGFVQAALQASPDNPVSGVKGVSPLLFVPKFDIVTGFVPDYLHCVLLGVVRMFVSLWFDSCNHDKPWYIGPSRAADVSSRLTALRPPSDVSRLPRSLAERKYWKGSECKSFLLYYSLLVLDGVLETKYLNHWFLLVFSIHVLLQDCVQTQDTDLAERVLAEFAVGVHRLYGLEYCTFNVHQLLHLPAAVRNWGPLWAFSCFRFESNIGKIVGLVRGSKGVPLQIYNSFVTRAQLPALYSRYCSVQDVSLEVIINRLRCSAVYVRKHSVISDGVHLYGSPLIRSLTLRETMAFTRLYGVEPRQVACQIYERLCISSLYMTATSYRRCRNCDDTVQLDSGEFCVVRCCAVGKFVCSCEELCDCTERAVLFVHVLDKQPGHALLRNRELGITSDKFVTVSQQSTIVSCCKPASVVRKCFRWRKHDVDYVTPMPTRHELD